MFHRSMFVRTIVTVLAGSAVFLSACSKKSEAELAEAERAKLREEKRQEAVKVYQELSEKFPEHPKARDAAGKVQALNAAGPKK